MLRHELSDLCLLGEDLLAEEMPGVLATLFSSSGSTYRTLGSIMLGCPASGCMAGGVSGGCLEEYILRRGQSLTAQQPAALLRFVDDPRAGHFDVPVLGCGSSIDVLVERFHSDHLAFMHQCAEAHDSDQAAVVSCVVDTSIRSTIRVRRSVLREDEIGTESDSQLADIQQTVMESQLSQHIFLGRDLQALVQFVQPKTRLVILGAGNDVQPLCTLGRSLGWHVSVADRRARLVTRSRFPDADQLVASDWRSALQSITLTRKTAVVLMTHSLADDAAILPLLVERQVAYVGVLGPERRKRWLAENAGTDLPASFVKGLHGPVGLDLGDRSAGGIAVSIVAEILTELNGRTSASLSLPDSKNQWTQASHVSLADVYSS